MYRNLAYAIATILAFSLPVHAQSSSVAASFQRIGNGESLTAFYSDAAGTPTVGTYGGLTEIIVSGTGNALGATVSDAFYYVGGSPVGMYYGLNMGYTGVPFAGGQNANIQRNMYFIDGTGDASLNTIPGYAADHTYRFVLDLPADAGTLRFGVSDGVYGDNGGAYNVSVYPVMRVVAPEASTIGLAAVVAPFLGVFLLRRKRS